MAGFFVTAGNAFSSSESELHGAFGLNPKEIPLRHLAGPAADKRGREKARERRR